MQFKGKRFLVYLIVVFMLATAVFVIFRLNNSRNSFASVYFTASPKEMGENKVELVKNRPEIRFKKWNGEVNLGVTYDKLGQKELVVNDNKFEWRSSKEEVHAYPVGEQGFEIEVVLKEKPDTNKFDFSIEGAEDLNFFYQPALNAGEQDPRWVTVTETDGFDANGKVLAHRPENVVGSYAVYHKNKKDYVVGQTNYGTGKAYHIYRPKAIDANGTEIWAKLSYENSILSVTVPQEFLDTATYPIKVDPTFGTTGQGASAVDFSGINIGGQKTITEAGTGTSISIWYGGTVTAGDITCNIYTTGNSLLANGVTNETVDLNPVDAGELVTLNFTAAPTFVASTAYMLVCNTANGTGTRNMYTDAASSQPTFEFSTYGTWPSTAAFSSESKIYSIYSTYSVAAATPVPPPVRIRGGVKIKGGVKIGRSASTVASSAVSADEFINAETADADGTDVTDTIAGSGSFGDDCTYSIQGTNTNIIEVDTDNDLGTTLNPYNVDGTEYSNASGTRGWSINLNNTSAVNVRCVPSGAGQKLSMGFRFKSDLGTPGVPAFTNIDLITIIGNSGTEYCVFQAQDTVGSSQYIIIGHGDGTPAGGDTITLSSNTTYIGSIQYDSTAGVLDCSVAIYDTSGNQVGSTSVAAIGSSTSVTSIDIGKNDQSGGVTFVWIDAIAIDNTDGTFPLK